jgi:hypothetical protein
MPNRLRYVVILIAAGLPVGTTALGQVWIEPRDSDAGPSVNSAQVPDGMGALTGIQGVLDGDLDFGPPDFQDLFAINIFDPVNFSATTVTLGGGADVDTNLWLFNQAELGRLGNRDFGGGMFSRLTPIADDGSFALSIPGIYYIGVSGGDSNRPTSGGQQIFNFLTSTELSGPDGPGGAGVHTGWSGTGESGVYFIQLTGVSFVPAPGAGAILGASMLALGARRRRM